MFVTNIRIRHSSTYVYFIYFFKSVIHTVVCSSSTNTTMRLCGKILLLVGDMFDVDVLAYIICWSYVCGLGGLQRKFVTTSF